MHWTPKNNEPQIFKMHYILRHINIECVIESFDIEKSTGGLIYEKRIESS